MSSPLSLLCLEACTRIHSPQLGCSARQCPVGLCSKSLAEATRRDRFRVRHLTVESNSCVANAQDWGSTTVSMFDRIWHFTSPGQVTLWSNKWYKWCSLRGPQCSCKIWHVHVLSMTLKVLFFRIWASFQSSTSVSNCHIRVQSCIAFITSSALCWHSWIGPTGAQMCKHQEISFFVHQWGPRWWLLLDPFRATQIHQGINQLHGRLMRQMVWGSAGAWANDKRLTNMVPWYLLSVSCIIRIP